MIFPYTTKTVKIYIVYDLENWPKDSLRNFALKYCSFGVINIANYYDNKKSMCIVAKE